MSDRLFLSSRNTWRRWRECERITHCIQSEINKSPGLSRNIATCGYTWLPDASLERFVIAGYPIGSRWLARFPPRGLHHEERSTVMRRAMRAPETLDRRFNSVLATGDLQPRCPTPFRRKQHICEIDIWWSWFICSNYTDFYKVVINYIAVINFSWSSNTKFDTKFWNDSKLLFGGNDLLAISILVFLILFWSGESLTCQYLSNNLISQ